MGYIFSGEAYIKHTTEGILQSFPRGHVLNWGLFDYKCKFGVGEFAADGYGFGVNFLNTFVLEEDRHIFENK